jgi:hypothetical protein
MFDFATVNLGDKLSITTEGTKRAQVFTVVSCDAEGLDMEGTRGRKVALIRDYCDNTKIGMAAMRTARPTYNLVSNIEVL